MLICRDADKIDMSKIAINNCKFNNCISTGLVGGAIRFFTRGDVSSTLPTITNCTFTNNSYVDEGVCSLVGWGYNSDYKRPSSLFTDAKLERDNPQLKYVKTDKKPYTAVEKTPFSAVVDLQRGLEGI